MLPLARWSPALFCLMAACASAPHVDRPVPLEAGYAIREAGASEAQDRCGPEFMQERLPGPLVSLIGPVLDGPFRPVCERHDACYRLSEKSQAWCDARMRQEMLDICAAGRDASSAGAALCRLRAGLYHASVDNMFGAYAYEGEAGGEMSDITVQAQPGGQLRVCAGVHNTTNLMQEYVLELRDGRARRLARAPRLHERNVRAGEAAEICLTAKRSDPPGGPLELVLIADRPDTLTLRTEPVPVDRRPISSGVPAAR